MPISLNCQSAQLISRGKSTSWINSSNQVSVAENYWNNELRIAKVRLDVDEIYSFFDSVNLDKFRKSIGFLIKMFQNEEVKQKAQQLKENLLHELKIYTKETLASYVERKSNHFFEKNVDTFIIIKIFEYCVKKFHLQLRNESKAFLELQFANFCGSHRFNKANHEDLELKIKDIKIKNLLTDDPEERNLLSCVYGQERLQSDSAYNFVVYLNIFNIIGKIHNNKWKVFNNFEVITNPLVVRFSNEVFEELYDFVWNSKMDHIGEKDPENMKLDSELNECFFADPNKFQQKKVEIAKRKKKIRDLKMGKDEISNLIPNLYRRFKFSKNVIYLTYRSRNLLLVG